MNVVVDTNIVFSGVLSGQGNISSILLNSEYRFEFYSPSIIVDELDKHHRKLIGCSKLPETELQFLKRLILKRIELINIDIISYPNWEKALELTKIIDEYDTPFVALSLELNAPLWTGDKKLIKALETLDFPILSTNRITEIWSKK